MIRAIIAEDEDRSAEVLTLMLSKYCPEVKVLYRTTSLSTTREKIKELQPDVLFLDVELADGTAFDVLDSFENKAFPVIITTAFDQYAVKAFKYSAIDYLLKPIDTDELRLAITKLKEFLEKPLATENWLLQKIAVNSSDTTDLITIQDILYCEASANYTILQLNNGSQITSSKNLGYYEKILPASFFFRAHNSCIVNMAHVKKYVKGRGGILTLNNEKEIIVASRRINDLKNWFI